MKILYIVHQLLPPKHVAGTEIYTINLAREMQARGHQVHLYFTESYADREQYELATGSYRGIPYFEAVHNYEYENFTATWRDPRMEKLCRQVLDRVKPDLVHIQHLHLHSIGYIDLIAKRGTPLVYTLHEYLLMCPAGGQLLRPGLRLCPGPEPAACARCTAQAPPPEEESRETAVTRRLEEIRKGMKKVDLFISPSAFLREMFLRNGMVDPGRIIHSDNGFFTEAFERVPYERSDRLRVGYIGTLAEYKGVHLLIEAFRGIPADRALCRIYGDLEMFPAYGRRLRKMKKPENVELMGRFDNSRVGRVLAGIDLLVIPSLWYENSPLTIHEAYLAGIPVIASDQGGMAELVKPGATGLHFRLGDAEDLRRQITRCLEQPGLLEDFSENLPAVKSIAEDAWIMEDRYCRLTGEPLP